MCMGSSLSVVRFSELKSVPVVDQEVLVHGGTWLPCSFCSHAHYSHTSATFTSRFFFISYDFCLVLPSDDLANTFILPTEIFKPFVFKVFFFKYVSCQQCSEDTILETENMFKHNLVNVMAHHLVFGLCSFILFNAIFDVLDLKYFILFLS